ncbi:MAG TPA: hypothetical protein VIQ11_01375 [Mycobacterium sp.]
MSEEKTRTLTADPRPSVPAHLLHATRAVLAERERELLELKGPCSTTACRLHYAHSGPCNIKRAEDPS